MTRVIEAAGGVLWRRADTSPGVELALVHRRRQDDWSLPKGKAKPGEHPVITAVREVLEETGYESCVGPFLGSVHYRKAGMPKRIRFWSLEAVAGDFQPNSETDDLLWLPPDTANRIALARDHHIIARFVDLIDQTCIAHGGGRSSDGSRYAS